MEKFNKLKFLKSDTKMLKEWLYIKDKEFFHWVYTTGRISELEDRSIEIIQTENWTERVAVAEDPRPKEQFEVD